MNGLKSLDIKRVGGSTADKLSNNLFQEFLGLQKEDTKTLSPEDLTGVLWKTLEGTWAGNLGWNIIALPSPGSNPESQGDFILLVAPYYETLSFVNAGAPARNRGGNEDQFVAALQYHQHIADLKNNQALHVEDGMFLNLSNIIQQDGKAAPIPEFNIARSGTIPHGDSIMLLGNPPVKSSGAPDIPKISTLPPDVGPSAPLGYADPYLEPHKGVNVPNPNANLVDTLNQQKQDGIEVLETVTFAFDSANNGGILNIPFINKHANATRMQAIFWLEKMQDQNTGQAFDQLQYTQIIDLEFHQKFGAEGLITWPHVTVNTLTKQ